MVILSIKEAEEQGRKAAEWLMSEEGRARLREGLNRVLKDIEARKKARQISWEDLHRPCTI